MHEIVTLQFGQRANYLATHLWNIQESYFTYTPNTEPSIIDHDVHFRPGIGTDGSDTYTPRTVIYDLKGGFGTLKQLNSLYDDASNSTTTPTAWNDRGLTTIKQQPLQQITYQQNLDAGLPTSQLRKEQVRYWSDFNRVFFHPRSIVQLNEYSLNSQLTPFENWSAGEELWRDVDREADLLDRDVRLFVEECDQIQGIQIFAQADDAWGGWTERYVDALRDEYGKKSIWVWGIEDTRQVQRDKAVVRKANAARTLSAITKLASAYIRLSTVPQTTVKDLQIDSESDWETTALMAAAVESVTTPMRLRAGAVRGSSMAGFEQTLNTNDGQNVWNLGLNIGETAIPQTNDIRTNVRTNTQQQQQQHQDAEDERHEKDARTYTTNFTPEVTTLLPNTLALTDKRQSRNHIFAQVETSRIPKRALSHILLPAALNQEELLRRRYDEEAIVERYAIPLSFPLLDAYPATLFPSQSAGGRQQEVSLSSGLSTSSATKQNVFELRDLVTRYSRAIAIDEREELYSGLTDVGEKYAFGWDSGEDSEDE